MATCFGLNLDSDALSSDILAPHASQARSTQALALRIQRFSHIYGEKSEGKKKKT
jgi:hypothetical protein